MYLYYIMNFEYTNNIKKKNINTYVFTVYNNIEKILKTLEVNFNINKIPKSFLKSNELFKKLYYDDFEILFIFMKKKCNYKTLYESFGLLGKELSKNNENILIILDQKDLNNLKNQIISFILGNYKTLNFKTDVKPINNTIYFYHTRKYEKIIKNSIYIGKAQNEVRFLTNSPANILNNNTYETYIKNNKLNTVTMKVINENNLKKLNMNLILAVNEGSQHKARLIQLIYKKNVKKNEKPVVFIGKGVMFDSGGYNIKLKDFSDMKNDMTSSAIIYSLMNLIAYHEIDGYFIGLLPIVENMVDAKAIRPGDIFKGYNKKTVEIIDTDAEGRLILADSLAYSEVFNPKLCIDLGTLAGINESFMGNKVGSILGNNNRVIKKIIYNGEKNNELLLELPIWEEYISETKSDIADLKNYGSCCGGIFAGAFLSNFVPENTSWVHIDIAGIDYLQKETDSRYGGGTGNIIRTLFDLSKDKELLKNL